MKNNLLVFFVSIFSFFSAYSQSGTITGSVQDDKSNEPIHNVKILIQNSNMKTHSDSDGIFYFNKMAPSGKQTLLFSKSGYSNKSFEVIVPDNGSVSIDSLKLTYKIQINSITIEQNIVEDIPPVNDQFTISLSDDTSDSDNISGLL